MPDFDNFILVVKENNKVLFAAEKIQIKPSSLESQLEKAFWAGFNYSEELQKLKKDSGGSNDILNTFKDIFGGKK